MRIDFGVVSRGDRRMMRWDYFHLFLRDTVQLFAGLLITLLSFLIPISDGLWLVKNIVMICGVVMIIDIIVKWLKEIAE